MKHQLAGKATTAEPCRARRGTVPALSETQRGATRHPILQLQRTIGNQAVNRLLQSGRLQTKLTVSRPGDTPVQRQEFDEEELLQSPDEAIQKQPGAFTAPPAHHPNRTGLPDNLKSGIESLSGFSMDDVTVHYNSAQPVRLNALAYTQGTEIHIAPGQEQHLPHEAWHVVQQAQGRVQPTRQLKGGVSINDDQRLEHEADVMGVKADSVGGQAKKSKEVAPLDIHSSVSQAMRIAVVAGVSVRYTDDGYTEWEGWHINWKGGSKKRGSEQFHLTSEDRSQHYFFTIGANDILEDAHPPAEYVPKKKKGKTKAGGLSSAPSDVQNFVRTNIRQLLP